MPQSEMPAPMPVALDYDTTIIGALELSDNKWVLAVQASCGLHHVENESLRGPDLRARPDGIAHLTAVISLGPRLLDVWQ